MHARICQPAETTDLRRRVLRPALAAGAPLPGDEAGAIHLGVFSGAGPHGAELLGAGPHGAELLGAGPHGAGLLSAGPHGAELLGAGPHGAGLLSAGPHGAELLSAGVIFAEPCPFRASLAGWRLRGMATEPARRGSGAGTLLLHSAHEIVRSAGGDLLWCYARSSAVGFYLRDG